MSASSSSIDVANVAAYLPRMARDQPDVRAIVSPRASLANAFAAASALDYETLTYAELDLRSDLYASGLAEVGIRRGDRVVLMVPPSLPFFALVFGLFKAGVVPVVLDPGMGPKRLTACIARSEPSAFIGIPRAHLARRVLGWGASTIRTNVVVDGPAWPFGPGAVTLDEVRRRGEARGRVPLAPVEAKDLAAVLFTSGSTGVPKGALYTHGNFLAQVEAIRAMYCIAPGEIDLPTFPLFALFDPALGMTTVLPRMDFTKPGAVDAAHVLEPIRRFGVTNMFGSPALLARVASQAEARGLLGSAPYAPSLRRVITAGAPVTPRVLESFARLLDPSARIHTPYGATESLPIATIDHRTILGETRAKTDAGAGICVGRPVTSADVRILRIVDGPLARLDDADLLPAGEIGEIVVAGPQVTAGYFRDEPNTTLHKLHDARGVLFHRVGDVGYFDAEGRLWFCGRKAQRVVVEGGASGGATFFTEQLEGPFNALPAVRRAALVGPVVGGRVVPTLVVELADPRFPAGSIGAALPAELLDGVARVVERVLVHPRFPLDPRHNAKIHREELAAWAKAELEAGRGFDRAALASHRGRVIR